MEQVRKIIYVIILCLYCVGATAQRRHLPQIGIAQSIDNDSLLHSMGYTCLVESTARLLSPRTVSGEQFQANLIMIRQSKIPLFACNLFIPGDLKVVGPVVDENAILQYADTVLHRARRAGLAMIVWGSGGSRSVPDGFDRAKAKEQFIHIARKVAAIASRYNITLVLENLNRTEVNFITTLREALEIVKAVDHKNFRLCADIYHMLKENESPSAILEAKGFIAYAEVAEKEQRTPPGTRGDDFRPYFSALRKIRFKGKIVIECRWQDPGTQGSIAYRELQKQLRETF